MTTTYTYQYMTAEDYTNYMLGSYEYTILTGSITANTKEEAKTVLKAGLEAFNSDLVVNYNSFKSKEEIAEEEQKRAEYAAEVETALAKRQLREAKPGYKARRNWMRCQNEIRKKEAMIEALLKEIKEEEAKAAHYAAQYEEETGMEIK